MRRVLTRPCHRERRTLAQDRGTQLPSSNHRDQATHCYAPDAILALARLLLRECDEIIDLMRLALGELPAYAIPTEPHYPCFGTQPPGSSVSSRFAGSGIAPRIERRRTGRARRRRLLTIGLAEFYRMRPRAIFQSAMMPPPMSRL